MAARSTPSRGGKPDKLMRDALMVALHRAAEDANGVPTKRLYLVADKLVDKAIEGDVPAIKEIFDRVDGKNVLPIEMEHEVGDTLRHVIEARRLEPDQRDSLRQIIDLAAPANDEAESDDIEASYSVRE